jgi:hypothetical protein
MGGSVIEDVIDGAVKAAPDSGVTR